MQLTELTNIYLVAPILGNPAQGETHWQEFHPSPKLNSTVMPF